MSNTEVIISNKKNATIAGALYLVVVLTGIFSLAYVPTQLIVWDNASTTFQNIVAAELLFRFGIVSRAHVMSVLFVKNAFQRYLLPRNLAHPCQQICGSLILRRDAH